MVKFSPAKMCLLRISAFLGLLIIPVVCLFEQLESAFMYNIAINSITLSCFLFGVFLVFSRVFTYDREFAKLLDFDKERRDGIEHSRLISPIVGYVSRHNKLVSQAKLNTILSSIERRVDDFASPIKYICGLLIFLGLFGTFWGLSHTIGNVANIIDNLGIEQADAATSFAKLKDSLRIPLSGMGVAFGCSLFGLSGSLILGFLNVNQKRVADGFLYEVEKWITKRTVSFDAVDNNQEYHGRILSMGLMEKTIEMIYAFQNQLKEFEGNRISLLDVQREFSTKLSQLVDAVSKHQELIKVIGNNQLELQSISTTLSKKVTTSVWDDILKKLDGIEKSMNDAAQSAFSNREYVVENIGREIRMVSKTLSSLMGE